MLIDDSDALREWLTLFLSPLCDADPPALARYCIALVRKDKPEEELKDDMLQQLDVFLQENTPSFVDKFLTVVASKSYLPKAGKSSTAAGIGNSNVKSINGDASNISGLPLSTIGGSNPMIPSSAPPLPSKMTSPPPQPPAPPAVVTSAPLPPLPPSTVKKPTQLVPVVPPTALPTLPPLPPLSDSSNVGTAPAAPLLSLPKKEEPRVRKEISDRDVRSRRSRSPHRRRSRSRGRRTKYDDRPRRKHRRSWSRSRSRSPPLRSRSPRHSRYSRTSPISGLRGVRRQSPNSRKSHSPPGRRSPSPIGRRSRSPPPISRRLSSKSPPRKSHSPLTRSRSPLSPHHTHRRSRSPLLPIPSQHLVTSKLSLLSRTSPDRQVSPTLPDEDKDSSPEIESSRSKFSSGRRKKHRCKDYDEQGYCMRGDQCPYDHGSDPMVLDYTPTPFTGTAANNNSGSTGGNGGTATGGGGGGEEEGVVNVLVPPPPHLAARLTLPPGHPQQQRVIPQQDSLNEYTPSDPTLWGDAPNTNLPPPPYYGGGVRIRGTGGPPPPVMHPHSMPPPVHLIHPHHQQPPPPNNMPPLHLPPPGMMPPQHMLPGRELSSGAPNTAPHYAKGHIRGVLAQRLGPATARGAGRDRCSLELRKVPQGLNSITHLNDHFNKFGTIVNIQVHHEGDPEAAIVTFSKHSEANSAYRSTEAVLNNRFIKVLWYSVEGVPGTGGAIMATGGKDRSSVTTSLTTVFMRNPNKYLSNTAAAAASQHQHHFIVNKVPGPALGSSVTQDPELSGPTSNSPDSSTQSQATAMPARPPRPTAAEIRQQQIDIIMQQQKQLAEEVAERNKEEKRKAEAVKLKNEVHDRTTQLLDKQMQQLKLLLTKLESCKGSMKVAEQKSLLGTIKSLQTSIETTKKRLKNSIPVRPVNRVPPQPIAPFVARVAPAVAAVAPSPVNIVTGIIKENSTTVDNLAKKKTIAPDTELDAHSVTTTETEPSSVSSQSLVSAAVSAVAASVNGVKTIETESSTTSKAQSDAEELAKLQSKLAILEAQARSRAIAAAAARGMNPNASAKIAPVHYTPVIERRPTKIHASGFEREDKDDVLSHFASLGNVITFLWDGQTPSVTVEYSTRRHAEKAMSEGRTLGDRLLTLTWVSDPKTVALPPVPSTQRYQELQYDAEMEQENERASERGTKRRAGDQEDEDDNQLDEDDEYDVYSPVFGGNKTSLSSTNITTTTKKSKSADKKFPSSSTPKNAASKKNNSDEFIDAMLKEDLDVTVEIHNEDVMIDASNDAVTSSGSPSQTVESPTPVSAPDEAVEHRSSDVDVEECEEGQEAANTSDSVAVVAEEAAAATEAQSDPDLESNEGNEDVNDEFEGEADDQETLLLAEEPVDYCVEAFGED